MIRRPSHFQSRQVHRPFLRRLRLPAKGQERHQQHNTKLPTHAPTPIVTRIQILAHTRILTRVQKRARRARNNCRIRQACVGHPDPQSFRKERSRPLEILISSITMLAPVMARCVAQLRAVVHQHVISVARPRDLYACRRGCKWNPVRMRMIPSLQVIPNAQPWSYQNHQKPQRPQLRSLISLTFQAQTLPRMHMVIATRICIRTPTHIITHTRKLTPTLIPTRTLRAKASHASGLASDLQSCSRAKGMRMRQTKVKTRSKNHSSSLIGPQHLLGQGARWWPLRPPESLLELHQLPLPQGDCMALLWRRPPQ